MENKKQLKEDLSGKTIGGGSASKERDKNKKPNLSLIAFIVITLLTVLILISC